MNKIELNIKSPWALLISLCMFITFVSVTALADSKSEILYNTEGEPIGIVGYTEHGVPVTKDEVKVRSINTRQIKTRHINTRHIKTRYIKTRHIKTRQIKMRLIK